MPGKKEKKRYVFMDLLRILSFGVIFVYHFFKNFTIMGEAEITDPDVVLGSGTVHIVILAVGIFFMLSGAGLVLSMKEEPDWKKYYIDRFKKILIPFYIAYLITFIYRFFIAHTFSIAGIPKWTIILTAFGMDEWATLYGFRTFGIGVGEWFLGALIIMYIVFPAIYIAMKKYKWPTFLIFTIYYIIRVLTKDPNDMVPWHLDVTVRIYEFVLGMFLAMNIDKLKRFVIFFAFFGFGWVPIPRPIIHTLICLSIFYIGIFTEDLLASSEKLSKWIKTGAANVFYVFLIHHSVIYAIGNIIVGHILGKKQIALLFVIEAVIILALALVIRKVSEFVWKKIT